MILNLTSHQYLRKLTKPSLLGKRSIGFGLLVSTNITFQGISNYLRGENAEAIPVEEKSNTVNKLIGG